MVSVVAPVFNEEAGIAEFHRRVTAAMSGIEHELVMVDDGSSDNTAAVLASLAHADTAVRVLTLSRNFGHQAALTAGLDIARGAAVVTIDADLQDPPEMIPAMVERWRAGADVVHAVRRRARRRATRSLGTDPGLLLAARADLGIALVPG